MRFLTWMLPLVLIIVMATGCSIWKPTPTGLAVMRLELPTMNVDVLKFDRDKSK